MDLLREADRSLQEENTVAGQKGRAARLRTQSPRQAKSYLCVSFSMFAHEALLLTAIFFWGPQALFNERVETGLQN